MGSSSWWQADWIWTATGWTLAAIGLSLLVWALFWDRSRGRRRCPKCWYDMSGVPGLRCPECGKEARSEHRLKKMKRRWRLTPIAVAAWAAGWVAMCIPRVVVEGWTGLAPTPALAAVVILVRDREPTRSWSSYLRKNTEVPTFTASFPPEPLRRRIARWCTSTIAARVKQGQVHEAIRSVCYRVAWNTLDRDLDRYPPAADWYVKDMLYAFSNDRYPERSQSIGPLVAPRFEVIPTPIAGSPVYAMVRGEGIGDQDARIDVMTEWRTSPTALVTLHTVESSLLWAIISTPGITYDEVISLGVPPEGAKDVRVTISIRRNMQGSWREPGPVLKTRVVSVPINVRPRVEDPLIPVDADAVTMMQIHAAVGRSPYDHEPHLNFHGYSIFDWPLGAPPVFGEMTVGAKFEVLAADRRVLYQGEVCLWEGQVLAIYPWGGSFGFHSSGTWASLRPAGDTQRNSDDSLAAWVRFTGDADLARQNPYCTKYYRGTWEIPLDKPGRW